MSYRLGVLCFRYSEVIGWQRWYNHLCLF